MPDRTDTRGLPDSFDDTDLPEQGVVEPALDMLEDLNRINSLPYKGTIGIRTNNEHPVTAKEFAAVLPVLKLVFEDKDAVLTWKERDVLAYWLFRDPGEAHARYLKRDLSWIAVYGVYLNLDQTPTQEWISHRLHITLRTVSSRLTRALRKLGLTRMNAHETVRYALFTAAEKRRA